MSDQPHSATGNVSILKAKFTREREGKEPAQGFHITRLDGVTLDFLEECADLVEAVPAVGGPFHIEGLTVEINAINPTDLDEVIGHFKTARVVRLVMHLPDPRTFHGSPQA